MPNRNDVLRDETFKGEVEDVGTRVFYTLTDKQSQFQAHRASKLLSSLIELLHKKNIVTDEELDEMLIGLRG